MNIRQKFLLLFLVVGLVPTLGVGLLSFVTISSELNKRTTSELASLDTKQQQTINTLLQSKQEAVIKLSNAYDFQTALEQYLSNRNQANHDSLNTIMHAELAQVPTMVAVNVADLGGNILVSTDTTREGRPMQQQPGFYGDGQGPAINIMEDQSDGLEELYISTTISVNKQDSAILRILFRVDDLIGAVGDYTGLGSTGETVITEQNEAGKSVSLLPLRFSTSAVEPFKANKSGQRIDYRNHVVMVSSRPVGFSDWTISTKIDKAEALAPISQLRDALIVIFIITAIIIALAALYLTQIITKPILLLAQVSERIGRGDFDARVDLQRKDEIGALAGSINALGTSLKAFVSGLESQRNHLAIILDSTNDTILAVNQRGIITTANQAAVELTRRPLNDILGRPMSEVFEFTSELQPFTVNLEAPGTNSYSNIECADVVGTKHYLRLIVARLHATQSESEQTIITIRDETKNRELENMKVDFVSMAAHELRTPLAAIKGYIELINMKLKKMPPEIADYLNQSLKSAVELGGLINNLLDVSRIERGTLTLNMEEADLAASVSKALNDVGFTAKDKKISMHYEGPESGCKVAADEIALREVITNLITNAIKYTQDGGHVEVKLDTNPANTSYQVSVTDNGMGIPRSALPHLFTKFYRVHGGLDSGSTGTGLGLFIAKSIIERHEGTIRAESTQGKGSTFTFTIPILTPERLASIQAREQAKGETTRRHRGWITKNTAR